MGNLNGSSQDTDSGTARRRGHHYADRLRAVDSTMSRATALPFKPYVYRGNDPFVPTPKQAAKIAASKAS